MKRCSGYLKRPEILETVYSVEAQHESNVGGNNTDFSLRTRMRLATLWSPDSRERGRTPGRR